jgi:hypothetical protein
VPGVVGEAAAKAALEVAFFNNEVVLETFPGAFFVSGGGFGRGHSRSRLNANRDPVTHSSSRLLNESQCTKNSHLSSDFGAVCSASADFRVRRAADAAEVLNGFGGLSRMDKISAKRSSGLPSGPVRRM